jgi:branched-subunit amino acid aminotransferase/4-amino-4-deoxychorismate lyase
VADLDFSSEFTCLDGEVMPTLDATISVTDDGLLRGDGVFEVVRLYEGKPFVLDEHLMRLSNSAKNLRLPVNVEAVREDVFKLLERTPGHNGKLRIAITRGGRRLAMTEPMPELPPTIRLAQVTYAPTRILDGIKSLSYGSNMLATRLAKERGFDEALLVTPHGRVLEAPTSTLFWVRSGQLYTTPIEEHVLASITRRIIFEVAGAQEQIISTDDLPDVEEAFLASTLREVMPVAAIEDREMPAPGPVTGRTRELVSAEVARQLAAL